MSINYSDSQLKRISKDSANQKLSWFDKERWVRLHNETANLYFVKNGLIVDVPLQGIWY